jgi:hypothetical protein
MSAATEQDLIDLGLVSLPSKDWAHQANEFKMFREKRARALFWSMRTGKSKAVIDKFCYQFGRGRIEGVVVLAPNGIHLNWMLNEIPKWAWKETGEHKAFGWETPKRADFEQIDGFNALLRHGGMKWLCVNMEAVSHPDCIKAIRAFLKACNGKIALAISEAHHFGHAGSKRTKMARNLAKVARYVTVETGTPILNSPLRAYSIFKILDDDGLIPESLRERAAARKKAGLEAMTYEDFVQHFAEIVIDKQLSRSVRRRAIKKIDRYKNMEELRGLMSPWASVVLREDVGDMPALIRTERIVAMSEKQRYSYLEMVSRHLVELGEDIVTAKDAGARVMKLQQILNGYIKNEDGIVEIDPDAPIYSALLDEVAGTLPGKSIVWCRYREDIRRACAILRKNKFKVLEFHGGVPLGKREGIRVAFNTDPEWTVLVGQPGAGGEGRDFSEADAIIFFSSTPNAIHVAQAEERGTVKGGSSTTIVRIRTPGTVDDRNWQIADGKVTLADTVSGRGLRDLLMQTNV